MKIVQSILSKSLLIALAILAGIGYYFRAELFPSWFTASAPEQQPAQMPRLQEERSVTATPAPPPVMAVPAPVTEMPAAPEPAMAPVNPYQEPSESFVPPAAEPKFIPEPAPAAPQAPAPAAPPAIEPQSNTDVERSAAPAMQSVASLDAARAAFWAQDVPRSEQLYQQLANDDQSAAEPLGELGNLYYMQGRWNEAAEAYAGAVVRLAKSGDIPHARHMLMILDGLDPARARAIWESGVVGGG